VTGRWSPTHVAPRAQQRQDRPRAAAVSGPRRPVQPLRRLGHLDRGLQPQDEARQADRLRVQEQAVTSVVSGSAPPWPPR